MDPYLILGVAENATLDEIRKAYRRLAIQLHPDAGGNLEDFKRLQVAYEEICRRAAAKAASNAHRGSTRSGKAQPEEPIDVEIFDEAPPEPSSSKHQEVEKPAKARPTQVAYSKKWPMYARIMAAACIGIGLLAYLVWPTVRLELAIQQGRWSEAVRLAPQNQRALLGRIRALLEDPECNFDELNSRLNDLEKLSPRNVPLAELQQKAWVRQGLAHIRAGKVNEAIQSFRS